MSRQRLPLKASAWRYSYNLDTPPPLNHMRKIARGQGYYVRQGREGSVGAGWYWLVDVASGQIATTQLTSLELWRAIALPSRDEGLWLGET